MDVRHLINKEPSDLADEEREPVVGYVHTSDLPQLFSRLKISLLVTTYQAQRILAFSSNGEKLSMLMRVFERPTGMALGNNSLVLCTKNQIWFFAAAYGIREPNGELMPYDVCYVPRRSHVTGDILAHQADFFGNELFVVNTRFSCLCTLEEGSSFMPRWKPHFVSEYVAEDRCHLNGLVIDHNGPRYVTALGESNTAEGWRDTKASGGIIIDVPSAEVITRGLCMPHSPRLYAGQLWVLESGTGRIQVVDQKTGLRTTVIQLPGYLRGLAFYDRYAFVGLCKIREKHTFGGLPIEELVAELDCAVHIIDIVSGASVGFIKFTKGIEELFDIQILPNVNKPHVIGFAEETVDGLFILPNGIN